MSGKKNKVRRKSGFLTGLVIVSTGLIAGFQGLELAMLEKNAQHSDFIDPGKTDTDRSAQAVERQVDALDRLVTASLDRGPSRTDRQGLAYLIQSANAPSASNPPTIAVQHDRLIVNRVLKSDRDPVRSAGVNLESNKLTKLVNKTREPLQQGIGGLSEGKAEQVVLEPGRGHPPQPSSARDTSIDSADNISKIAYVDSADIALFAADMPLPAKLIYSAKSNAMPLVPRGRGRRSYRSPLVPRKFVSGKAFGGLAERAFQKRERRCMTTALYFEARSEPETGQIAVGQVVMNRVRSPDYPDTICGVVYQGSHRRTGCQFSFTCDGKADKPNNTKQWERSKRLANQVLEGQAWLNSIGNATHYHANYVKPRWRKKMARLKQIGRHIFYKSPNISVTDTYQRYISGKRS